MKPTFGTVSSQLHTQDEVSSRFGFSRPFSSLLSFSPLLVFVVITPAGKPRANSKEVRARWQTDATSPAIGLERRMVHKSCAGEVSQRPEFGGCDR